MRRASILIFLALVGCEEKAPPAPSPAPPAAVAIPDGPGSPQATVREGLAAVVAGDPKAWWHGLSKADRDLTAARCNYELDEIRKRDAKGQEDAARELGVTVEALRKMSVDDYTLAQMKRDLTPESKTWAAGVKVERAEQRGDVAVVFTLDASGRHGMKAFVKEGGAWKSSALSPELQAEEDRLNGR